MELRLQSTVELTAAAKGTGKVQIVAYSGGVMDVAPFGPVVVDLAGLELPDKVPLLADHENRLDSLLGSGTPKIIGGSLVIEGTLAPGELADRLKSLAAAGVKLGASVGVRVHESRRLRPGESTEANGKVHTASGAGLTLVSRGQLVECSIVPIGADSTATVSIAAQAQKGQTMPTDTDTTTTDPAQAERQRVSDILAVCRGEYVNIQTRAITEGWSVEQTRAAVLDALRASRPKGPSIRGVEPPRHDLTGMVLAFAGRSDLAAKHSGGSAPPRPSGWLELARMACVEAGRYPPDNRNDLLKAAFSTTNLPNAVGAAVEKIALETFREQSETWRSLCRIVAAANFREGKALRLSAAAKFLEVPRGGELKHGDLAEDAFAFRVSTYGRMFGLSRQDLRDDDAGLLQDVPTVLGSEASRTVADLVFDALLNAGNFFHEDKKNLLTGTGSALAVDSLAGAIKLLRTQRDRDGRIIGFQPTTLLVPASLEAKARQLLNSTLVQRDQSADLQPMSSPFVNANISLVVEPRLDANSETAWYLFAQPQHGAILAAFLDGLEGAHVEPVDPPAEYLGQQWRAYMDVGVSLGEYRAVVKSTGA